MTREPTPLALYDRPAWYDALHAEGTASWADFLLRLGRRHGTGGPRWLEPACGTGRFLRVLGRRGLRVTGYDSHPGALAYARRRLPRGTEALEADMTSFVRPGAYDLAFCLLGSFRHLLDERSARRHLELTRRSLKPGGVYVVGLDLVDWRWPEPGEDDWKARRGGLTLDDLVVSLPPERRPRRERIVHFLSVRTPKTSGLYKSEYDLRAYDIRQWLGTARAAGFTVAAAYSAWRKPIPLDENARDATFVLQAARQSGTSRTRRQAP
ncbi:MAG: class I SAM-dependent methyltransferase [Elusimicrobia bacterium]|nr:class I SAM-dependent methyltransferase [Elusimicrobiota bacterium]